MFVRLLRTRANASLSLSYPHNPRLIGQSSCTHVLYNHVWLPALIVQHMRSHRDTTALRYRFSIVIGRNDANGSNVPKDKQLLSLRQHCLSPGQYHEHILRYDLKLFSTSIHKIPLMWAMECIECFDLCQLVA